MECPDCHRDVLRDSNFCPNCGHQFVIFHGYLPNITEPVQPVPAAATVQPVPATGTVQAAPAADLSQAMFIASIIVSLWAGVLSGITVSTLGTVWNQNNPLVPVAGAIGLIAIGLITGWLTYRLDKLLRRTG